MASKKSYNFKDTGIKYVDDVGRQLEKIFKTSNRGSLETRRRYFEASERFVKAVVPEFKLQNLRNISDKHLDWYAKYLKENGNADKYIKTNLSGIRYLHQHVPNTRHELSDSKAFNKSVGLGSTPDGRANRAWDEEEIKNMIMLANDSGRNEIVDIIRFTSRTGTRLDEAATIKRHHLEEAIRTGKLNLTNTKGGRPRSVPVNSETIEFFKELAGKTARGEYVFVPKDRKIHAFKREVQDFIIRARQVVQDESRTMTGHNLSKADKGALTFHGLRHSWANKRYNELVQSGLNDKDARAIVSTELGHGRESVTQIYIHPEPDQEPG